jgi:hypothetical protein
VTGPTGQYSAAIGMSEMNRSFSSSMPELYDRILVPVMFEPFARNLAERLRGMTSGQILEIAARTGVVTVRRAYCPRIFQAQRVVQNA